MPSADDPMSGAVDNGAAEETDKEVIIENDEISKYLAQAPESAPLLDLSNNQISQNLWTQLLALTHIEFLYLCNCDLFELPSEFFTSLANLKWLDIRFNQLKSLPTSIAQARKLVTLLLGNNKLQSLPLEIGGLKNLCSLNVTPNPLQFPPPHILQRGLGAIKKCLRQTQATLLEQSQNGSSIGNDKTKKNSVSGSGQQSVLLCQLHQISSTDDEKGTLHGAGDWSSAENNPDEDEENTEPYDELDEQDTYNYPQNRGQSPSWNQNHSGNHYNRGTGGMSRTKYGSKNPGVSTAGDAFNRSHSLKQRVRRRSDEWAEAELLRPRSASLQKRQDYAQLKEEKNNRIQRAGASGRLSEGERERVRVAKEIEDAKRRQFNTQVAIEQQKMKDKAQLDNWRQELRQMQRHNYHLRPPEHPSQILARTEKSPYAVDKRHLGLKNRQNMMKEDESNRSAALRNIISEESKKQIEQARANKDRDLEKRIKLHALNMQHHRTAPQASIPPPPHPVAVEPFTRPNSASNNMGGVSVIASKPLTLDQARQDLETALQLQRELHNRRTDLAGVH